MFLHLVLQLPLLSTISSPIFIGSESTSQPRAAHDLIQNRQQMGPIMRSNLCLATLLHTPLISRPAHLHSKSPKYDITTCRGTPCTIQQVLCCTKNPEHITCTVHVVQYHILRIPLDQAPSCILPRLCLFLNFNRL